MNETAKFRETQLEALSDEKRNPVYYSPGAGPSQHRPVPCSPSTRSQEHPSHIPQNPTTSPLRGSSIPFTPSRNRTAGQSQIYTRPRGLRISNLVKPWIPLILYGVTSFSFLVAIAFWRNEVFERLDELSQWLRVDEQFGYAVLFGLIFLTTFPPLPLYSTLIILSGYTFGPWTGAIISYCAALSGALTVFILSRTFLRDFISHWLSCTITIKRIVRAIERRPKLLFLIRLAPYPYNVLNCLLAASSTLTLQTYTICTALSLFKVIIHTSLGASIHSFKDYHVINPDQPGNATGSGGDSGGGDGTEDSANTVARMWTIIGVALCIAIFVYLLHVARKAVDDELGDDLPVTGEAEERIAFLSPQQRIGEGDPETDIDLGGHAMAESPFSTRLVPSRQVSSRWDGQDRDDCDSRYANIGYFRGGDEEASIGL